MKPSAYLQQQADYREAYKDAAVAVEKQMLFDSLQVTLHTEFGWGYDRLTRLTEKWAETYSKYHAALEGGMEADVWQERLDAILGDIAAGRQKLIPFSERYPEIRPSDYTRPPRKGRRHGT